MSSCIEHEVIFSDVEAEEMEQYAKDLGYPSVESLISTSIRVTLLRDKLKEKADLEVPMMGGGMKYILVRNSQCIDIDTCYSDPDIKLDEETKKAIREALRKD